MKFFSFLGGFVLCLAVLNAFAQQADLPAAEPQNTPTPAPQATATPLPSIPKPIIPPDLLALPTEPAARPSVPAIPELDQGFTPAPLSPAAQSQRQHIEWRKLRNAVQNDRDIKAALRAAREARTDLERRQLLGRYYDLFYDRMIARAAPDMKAYLLDRKREAVGALPQPRVRPDVRMSRATPSPTRAPKP